MYLTKAAFLMVGSLLRPNKPYLSLSGTSMASPVVAGTVALMLQANPTLTPNMVKAIIQYTAQEYGPYDSLTQGAGFLNTRGAVHLARFFKNAKSGDRFPMPRAWSKQLLWGNNRIKGGVIRPNANAFKAGTTWGASMTGNGDNIVWGTVLGANSDNIVWGTFDTLSNIVWGTLAGNIGDNIVWGTHFNGDNIVWGTVADVDNIVWGTDCGGGNCDNIVWGTAGPNSDNIVWGTAEYADNIVWGTNVSFDNIVWGTNAEGDNITWGTSGEDTPLFDDPNGAPDNFDQTVWANIFQDVPVVMPVSEPVFTTTSPLAPVTSTVTSVKGILGGGF
jgi:hypothetical protein